MVAQTRPLVAAAIVGLLTGCTLGTIPDTKVVRWVEETVEERQAAPEDKRFDEIGWVTDIREAIKLGREHNRPIFLFTGDGRINTGRC